MKNNDLMFSSKWMGSETDVLRIRKEEKMIISTAKKLIKTLCVITFVYLLCSVTMWYFIYSQNGADHFFAMNVLVGKSKLVEENSLNIGSGQSTNFSFVSFQPFDTLEVYINSNQDTEIKFTLLDDKWNKTADAVCRIDSGTDDFVPVFSGLTITEGRSVYVLQIENISTNSFMVGSRGGGTAIKANGGFPFVLVLYCLINLCIYLCLIGYIYTGLYKRYELNKVFLATIIPLIIIFSLLLYPGTACDENDHYVESYFLSNRILGINENVIRAEDEGIINSRWAVPNIEGVYLAATQFGHRTTQTELIKNVHPGHLGSPIVYLLPAVGISIGRELNLNAFTTYYLARIFNILFYLVVGYLTLSCAKCGNSILFCFLLLPLTINQCCSVNQDSFCYSMSFLAIAYWTRLREKMETYHNKLSICEVTGIIMLFCLLLQCKAYVLIMGIYLTLPWFQTYNISRKTVVLIFFTFGLVLTTAVAIIGLYGGEGYASHLIEVVFGNANNGFYTLAEFAKNPIALMNLIINTIKDYWFAWFWDAFGSRLSWETYFSPIYALILFVVIALISVSEKRRITGAEKVIHLLIQLAFFGLTVLRALSWTPIGSERILGIQGRYFIPTLCLLFFRLKNEASCFDLKENRKYFLTVFVIVLSIICLDLLNNHILTLVVE